MIDELELLSHVQQAREDCPKCKKLAGSITVEIIRVFLRRSEIPVSARDVFIRGVPVELDLLVPNPKAKEPRYELIYEPSDVLAAFEVKNSGVFSRGALDSIRGSFDLIRSANSHIYCAYITLAEQKNFKWAATAENLGADVYTLLWHHGSTNKRRYDQTGDWNRLTGKLNGLLGRSDQAVCIA